MIKRNLLSLAIAAPALLCAALPSTSIADSVHSMAAAELASLESTTFKVTAPSDDLARKAAISFHANLLETDYEQGFMVMTLNADEVKKLEKFDFKVEAATDFVETRGATLSAMMSMSSVSAAAAATGIPGYACYETVEETFSDAEDIAATYSNLAEWIDVGNSWKKENGSGGYDIRVLKLTNKNTTGDKPVLFANSSIHAREYTTAPLNLAFAKYLVEGYGTDADATWILDHHEVHLMLVTNPDGRKKAETGVSWRKNHNENASCWRNDNLDGIDLNRNFTGTWGTVSGGSSGTVCDETYRGDSPASEPETQAIEAYVRGLWPNGSAPTNSNPAPDSTSGIHLDIHSYSELILWPWGNTDQLAPNADGLTTLGRKFADFNGYMPQQSVGLYPTDGTSDNVSYGERGIPAYTFELGTAFFQNCSTFENTIKPDNLPALVYAAKVVRTPYVTPSGPDIDSISMSGNAANGGVEPGTVVTLSATATDGNYSSRNGNESTQNINAVRYYMNKAPWENGASGVSMSGNFNSKTETATASIDTTGMAEGQYMVYVQAQDTTGTWGAVSAEFLYVTDDPVIPPTEYCAANGGDVSDEWISSVTLGGFTNASNADASGYQDFTSKTASLTIGNNAVTLVPGYAGQSYKEYWKIFIDLNDDGDFTDSGETVFDGGSAAADTKTGTMTIPAGSTGEHRMRVVMRYNAEPSSCGTFNYGEVEDYTANITEGDGGGTQPTVFESTESASIPDNNTSGATTSLDVTRTGDSGTVSVAVNITHTYIGDLQVDLIAPDGTVKTLHDNSGSGSDNISQTYSVNVSGVEANGTWSLKAVDSANQDTGTINAWSITFSN